MTVAEEIKSRTKALSVERGLECACNAIRELSYYFDGVVWVCNYQFVDGSTLLHRGYIYGA